jgi:hypothetical protein
MTKCAQSLTDTKMSQDEDLTQAEKEALREIVRPSLIPGPIRAKAQDRLIEMGYVDHTRGRLVATAKGSAYLVRLRNRRRRTWHPA